MNKFINIIRAFVLSLGLVMYTVIYGTSSPIGWEKYQIIEKLIIYGFPILALIVFTFLIYKVLSKPKKLVKNKDNRKVLIIKQIFNGIALCFFVNIVHNYMWPLDTAVYKEMEPNIMWGILFTEIFNVVIISLILIAICLVIVSLNKNANEYLKLITYSEIIIIPLLIIGLWYFEIVNPPIDMHVDYIRAIKYMITEYSLRILNVSLPLIFYLKLSKKDKGTR